MPTKRTPADIVTAVLEGYAEKALFRGFSSDKKHAGAYRMIWHYDRPFDLLLDVRRKTLRFPDLLPGIPARSPMYRDLKAFVNARQSGEMPEHRSVNRRKARVSLSNLRGAVSLALSVKDSDFEYATRKIIQIVHEVFLIFLVDGPYYDYTVEHLGLDPDRF